MKGKILIVDDVPQTRETLKAVLQDENYEVDTAADGQIAFDMVKRTSYDIVVMDIVMPNMTGVEAVKKIKEYRPEIFVVMMTGEASDEQKSESVKSGGYAVLRKPFKLEAFLQQIRWFQQIKELDEQKKRQQEYWQSLSKWQKFKIRLKRKATPEKIRLYAIIGILSIFSFFIALGILNTIFKTKVTFNNMYQTIVGYLQRDEEREIKMMNNR